MGFSSPAFRISLQFLTPNQWSEAIEKKCFRNTIKALRFSLSETLKNPPSHPKFLITAGNLAVPGGSWFRLPSNLQTLPGTMKAISKGHVAKSRCREGYPGFVQMSRAGVHPGRQKLESPIPKLICKSPSRREGGWGHLCLSGNHGALH